MQIRRRMNDTASRAKSAMSERLPLPKTAFKTPKGFHPMALAAAISFFLLFLFLDSDIVLQQYKYDINTGPYATTVIPARNVGGIPVFYPVYKDAKASPVTEKLMQDILHSAKVGEIIPIDVEHPGEFLESCGNNNGGLKGSSNMNDVQKRFLGLKSSKQPHLATELLKFCAMKHHQGGLYLDSQSTLTITIDHILAEMTKPASGGNLAVLNDPKISPDSVHGAMFYVKKKKSQQVIEGMIDEFLAADVAYLEKSPLFVGKTLHNLIQKDTDDSSWKKSSAGWHFLQHTCSISSSLGKRPDTNTPLTQAYALNSYRYVSEFCFVSIFDSFQEIECCCGCESFVIRDAKLLHVCSCDRIDILFFRTILKFEHTRIISTFRIQYMFL